MARGRFAKDPVFSGVMRQRGLCMHNADRSLSEYEAIRVGAKSRKISPSGRNGQKGHNAATRLVNHRRAAHSGAVEGTETKRGTACAVPLPKSVNLEKSNDAPVVGPTRD